MLYGLPKQVADCYRRAEECRELAELAIGESDRQFYIEREQAWLKLARSYELSERVGRVSNELQRRSSIRWKPVLADTKPSCRSCAVTMGFELMRPTKSIPAQAITAIEVGLFACPNCGCVTDELMIKPRS
jgi:hypothetical protein